MCRFVAYLGHPVVMADVIQNPANSLIHQSRAAQESELPLNGDGFGIGWYNHDIDGFPGTFKSVRPAWNDINLLDIASKVKSDCFFGHVRSATAGGISQSNCHPFKHEKMLMMHNGSIKNFIAIKRYLRAKLSDDAYDWIGGQTDTEHFFALFIDNLSKYRSNESKNIVQALTETVKQVEYLQNKHNDNQLAILNVAISDGSSLVALRYISNPDLPPRSLHYSLGSSYEFKEDEGHMNQKKGSKNQAIIVASERLSNSPDEWEVVYPNHFLIVDKNLSIKMEPFE